MSDAPVVLLDVDGTLIDSNYQHALAWHRALRDLGRVEPLVHLHRHIGMGGDQLVAAVAGDAFDAEHGDAARAAHDQRFAEITGDVAALKGATELVEELVKRGADVVLASSAGADETERYLRILGAEDLKHTTSADVQATKPQPDLVVAALELADGDRPALLVGDSTWDLEAAGRAGVSAVAVLTGGFSEPELEEAGAARVFADIAALLDALDEVLALAARPDDA